MEGRVRERRDIEMEQREKGEGKMKGRERRGIEKEQRHKGEKERKGRERRGTEKQREKGEGGKGRKR